MMSFLNLTCTVHHIRRLDSPMRGLHRLHPLYTKIICPHLDTSDRAVLNHLIQRGQCGVTQQATQRRYMLCSITPLYVKYKGVVQ